MADEAPAIQDVDTITAISIKGHHARPRKYLKEQW
jgi:hypothetical protein